MDEQTQLPRMKKKYWSGNIRLLSDFVWSIIISLIFRIGGNKLGIEAAPINFFVFFFWSWNEQHVKKRFAKWVIHILCWIIFLFSLLSVVVVIFEGWHPGNLESYAGLAIIFILSIGIAFKYKSIMWPKKKQTSDTLVAHGNLAQSDNSKS